MRSGILVNISNACTVLLGALLVAPSWAAAADLYSSGAKTWDTSAADWGNGPGVYSGSVWSNATPDSAFLEGTAGTVALGEAISIRSLTISSANYVITSNTLSFAAGGAITNAGNNVLISSAIAGSPSVRVATPVGNLNLTFAPVAGSAALGTITRPTDTYLNLGGSDSGNSLVAVIKGSSNAKVRFNGTGAWTVGNVYGGFIYINSGDLIVNGELTADYRWIELNGGVLHYNNPGAVKGPSNGSSASQRFRMLGGRLDNSSGSAITNSTYDPNMGWYSDWMFIGSQGANSDLYLGAGPVRMYASRTVTVSNALTTLTIGGVISDNGDDHDLTKAGAGTLALTGVSTYVGDTIVNEGRLRIGQPYLSDIAFVRIAPSGVLDLDFVGTDDVLAVYTNGVEGPQGTWGALGSGADNQTALITGTGLLNVPVPTALAGIRYWDGGFTNIVSSGNALSAGGPGTWSTSVANWDAGAGMAHTNWNNATNDLAFFRGAGGTVTLAEDITLGAIYFDADDFTIRSNSLHFAAGGVITNEADDIRIESGITGSPSMKSLSGVNDVCTLAPTDATMTLGTFYSSQDDVLKLAGMNTGHSLAGISGNPKIDKESSSTWAIHGDVATPRRFYVDGGTLIVNGSLAFTYTGARISSGATLVVNGSMSSAGTFNFNGGTLGGTGVVDRAMTVPVGGTLAPGYPTGTLTITNNNCTINGSLAITVDVEACSALALDPANTLTIGSAALDVNVLGVPGKPIVIADYGTLVGTFASITGADDWDIDYAYKGSQIALLPPPSGTVLIIR